MHIRTVLIARKALPELRQGFYSTMHKA